MLAFFRKNHCRFTLSELIVVLTILCMVAVLLLPKLDLNSIQLGPEHKDSYQITTELDMQTIFKAITGDGQNSGYYQDLRAFSRRMPKTLADLFVLPTDLPETLQTFHPETQMGWRGPYLFSAEGRYGEKTSSGFVFREGFEGKYGKPSDPAILDAWGNPIVLQIEFDEILGTSTEEEQYARLVSAGPNGIIDTPTDINNMLLGDDPTTQLTFEECYDDILLFLRVADIRGFNNYAK